MDLPTRRRHLARHLARFAAIVAQPDAMLDGTADPVALGLDNRVADEFVTSQLRRLLDSSPPLARRVRRVPFCPSDVARSGDI